MASDAIVLVSNRLVVLILVRLRLATFGVFGNCDFALPRRWHVAVKPLQHLPFKFILRLTFTVFVIWPDCRQSSVFRLKLTDEPLHHALLTVAFREQFPMLPHNETLNGTRAVTANLIIDLLLGAVAVPPKTAGDQDEQTRAEQQPALSL